MDLLSDFLDGDASSASARAHYLSMARNVASGNHSGLEVTGNAYHVSISADAVVIENLWDDDLEPLTVSLKQFVELMSS